MGYRGICNISKFVYLLIWRPMLALFIERTKAYVQVAKRLQETACNLYGRLFYISQFMFAVTRAGRIQFWITISTMEGVTSQSSFSLSFQQRTPVLTVSPAQISATITRGNQYFYQVQ